MMFERWILAILLLKFCCTDYGFCGKVLVWPTDMSHWLNMKTILEKLEERGHEMTVFVHSNPFLIDYKNSSTFNFQVIPMENNKQNLTKIMNELLDLITNVMPKLPFWMSAIKLRGISLYLTESFKFMCENVVYNKEVMKKLQETKYDVMITDPVLPCGELLAELLEIPFVYTLRFSMGHSLEKYCGKLPIPPSYVPVPFMGLTDKMTFLERVANFVFSVLSDLCINQYDDKTWDKLYSEVLDNDIWKLSDDENVFSDTLTSDTAEVLFDIQMMRKKPVLKDFNLCDLA